MGVAAPVVPVLDGWLEADRAMSILRSVTAILEKVGLPVNPSPVPSARLEAGSVSKLGAQASRLLRAHLSDLSVSKLGAQAGWSARGCYVRISLWKH